MILLTFLWLYWLCSMLLLTFSNGFTDIYDDFMTCFFILLTFLMILLTCFDDFIDLFRLFYDLVRWFYDFVRCFYWFSSVIFLTFSMFLLIFRWFMTCFDDLTDIFRLFSRFCLVFSRPFSDPPGPATPPRWPLSPCPPRGPSKTRNGHIAILSPYISQPAIAPALLCTSHNNVHHLSG